MLVFTLNKQGKPLMSCSPCKAKRLLRAKKAKVVRTTPFTIKLLYGSTGYKQGITAGMDTGSKKIGVAAVSADRILYQSEVELRNDITKKMKQRLSYRRTRRGRKTRYRKPRFLNRGKAGFLAPSIKSKIESHLREKRFTESILPVSKWILETASFDIHLITNPSVEKKGYQEGEQKGFYNTKAYILHRDGYKCQKCKKSKVKLQVHHIISRSNKGTNEPKNLITLCVDCHEKLHNGDFTIMGSKSKTKHATEMGIIKSQLKKRFGEFKEVFGYETKYWREQVLGLPKTHYNDAISIVCNGEQEEIKILNNVIYKKHVSRGDYQQTKGNHSEKKIPNSKLFGFKKFDKVKYNNVLYFIKGRMSSGYAILSNVFGEKVKLKPIPKFSKMERINARTTTQVAIHPPPKGRGFLATTG